MKKCKFLRGRPPSHGMRGTRFYKIRINMKDRCDSPKHNSYVNYGLRGITYDPSWKEFIPFREDMYDEYQLHSNTFGEKDTFIDRIYSNGNYTKENCRRATRIEQNLNKDSTIRVDGKCLSHYCKEKGISYSGVHSKLRKGFSLEDAIELIKLGKK